MRKKINTPKTKYRQKQHKPLFVRELALTDYNVHQSIVNTSLKSIKKDYGIFFTPESIVDFMVKLADSYKYSKMKDIAILEPACGLAQFLIGIKRNQPILFKKAKLFGVELNQDVVDYLSDLNISDNLEMIKADYLLWQPGKRFDLIIGNPPYGIPSLSDHYTIKVDPITKQKYKEIYETWYGKYNVYGAFIEKSIKLLKPKGQLIFIIPATFMILDEFKKLREFLAKNGETNIIYLGPDVFKPEADVASVVLNFYKSDELKLHFSEYKNNKIHPIIENNKWHGEIIKFKSDYTDSIENICSHLLGDVYDIKISPRTPEIKHSAYITKEEIAESNGYFPLLNGRNLKCNKIIYDNLTGYWIRKTDLKRLRGYFDTPHIVIGLGFRESGRVAAAYDKKCYPWMGDVYHLLRKTNLYTCNFDLSNSDLLQYLNSDCLKKYIKDIYREITYHLSITQLKNIPLPTKKEWEEIQKIRLW